MNKKHYLPASLVVLFAVMMIACNSTETKPAEEGATIEATAPAAPDMAKVKAEIQAQETAWAEADNARDVQGIAALYADDAVSLLNNKPMASGKAAILKDIEATMAARAKGSTISYEVMEVFGDENTVTEVGKATGKDADGKVTYTGKYMAIWAKRDGKYVCIRDIGNDDAKAQ
jgi:uncharacterized protein (TIGR02246 family)